MLLPDGSVRALLWPALNVAAVAAIATALAKRPSLRRPPWFLFLTAEALYCVGDVFFLTHPVMTGRGSSTPSADGWYLASYCVLIVALVALVRTRSLEVDRANLVDAAILSVGIGLLTWVFFMAPLAHDAALSPLTRAVSLAYPALDVLLFAGVARLSVGASRNNPALRLILAFAVTQLLADLVYSVQVLTGVFELGSPVLGGYVFAWIFIAAAALHPAADALSEIPPSDVPAPPVRRLALLALAALVAPAMMLIQSARGDYDEMPVLAVGSGILFALVLVRVRGLMVSVEQHKEVAGKLAEAEAKYRELLEHIPAVTYVDVFTATDDVNPVMMHIGPQVEALFGYTREEWLTQSTDPWHRLVHPDDHERVMHEGSRAAETGSFRTEYRMSTKDGRLLWIHEEASIEHDPATGTRTWRGVMVDVTERRHMEEALREAESRYRLLVERLPVAAYSQLVAEEGGSFYMSPQATQLLGYPPERWTEDEDFWRRLLHPDDLPLVEEIDKETNATGEPYACEYRVRRADGEYIWVRDEAVLIERDPEGGQVWHGVLADITERKRAQADLEASLSQLRRLNVERSRLLARLVDAQEAERVRIAEAIHDDPLQQLTAVGLRLSSLRHHVDADGLESLETLEGTVQTAITRMRRLLFELRPRTLDTGGLAEALQEYLFELHEIDGPTYRLRNNLAGEPPPQTRIVAYRIAQEALNNVRKHARASTVEVVLSTRDAGVDIVVQDDGPGADPEALGSSRPGHLGISSMRERAEMNGGWFRVDGGLGRGTRVEFWIPSLSPPAAVEETLGLAVRR
jgi:PAS domain S-box-containing protein